VKTLRERHHSILQSTIDRHQGYVFEIIGGAWFELSEVLVQK